MAARQRRSVCEKHQFFDFNWLPCNVPEESKKEVQIGDIRTNAYHLVQRSRE